MENPNTRPYMPEELEALLQEENPNNDIPKNNIESKGILNPVILQDNNRIAKQILPAETSSLGAEVSAEKPQTTSKLQTYAPFIILGIILTGVGIYLYYDYRKRKEAEKVQKPESE